MLVVLRTSGTVARFLFLFLAFGYSADALPSESIQPLSAHTGASNSYTTFTCDAIKGVWPSLTAFVQDPFVVTDKTSYLPGERMIIAGGGWRPGETVEITIHWDSGARADTKLAALADRDGNILNAAYVVQATDIGIAFRVTADHGSGRDPVGVEPTVANVSRLFADGPSPIGTQTDVFSAGHTIHSNGVIDQGTFGRVVINDGNGVNRFTSACNPPATFNTSEANPNGPPTYTFQPGDPPTTDRGHRYTYTIQQFASLANCIAGTPLANDKHLNFWFTRATAYSNPGMTIPRTIFAPGDIAYIRIEGFVDGESNVNTTWRLPGGALACENTGGSDRPDT